VLKASKTSSGKASEELISLGLIGGMFIS